MILHILGGGSGQLSAIRRCRGLGITSFVTDMNLDAPGCLEADYCAEASTFDADATAAAAEKFQAETGLCIGALLVSGTDQPVLTAARTAASLGIPYFLDEEQALRVTNKKIMKTMLSAAGIPTSPFRILGRDFADAGLEGLQFPLVVKPLDSQGQRGVYRLEKPEQLRGVIDEVLSYSRCDELLVEEYYPSDEITLSGWLENGKLEILTVTDRVTVENPPSIGVCVAHHYPSKYSHRLAEIKELTEQIVAAAELTDGPLYFQYLIGRSGDGGPGRIIVNEIACRLGGAYEDEFIPYITGVDILERMIRFSCGFPDVPEGNPAKEDWSAAGDEPVVSLQMFFCSEGLITLQSGMAEVLGFPEVSGGSFLLADGILVRNRRNSTQRAGYFIVCCNDKTAADRIALEAYKLLRIDNENGENMIQFYDRMLFGGKK